jgi:hypothetical protein
MPLSFEILRADDLLALRVDTVNLDLKAPDPKHPKLVVHDAKGPAYLVVRFPPQSIVEQVFLEADVDAGHVSAPGSVASTMAGESRLVFQLPPGMKEIPFTIEALLDWNKLQLVLSPVAQGKLAPPPIKAPTTLQTAIELPYRLLISPASEVGWLHAARAVTYAGRTELWHTRAGKPTKVKTASGLKPGLIETSANETIPLRAIWTPDFVDHAPLPGIDVPGPGAFLAPMTPRDRVEIVILTSGTSGYELIDAQGNSTRFVPTPVKASRLYLSSLGGWLSSRGDWSPLPVYTPNDGGKRQDLELSEWIHIATAGRDHYVRIVHEGFLFPLGHRAAWIEVTERIVVPPNLGPASSPVAYLNKRQFIVVREREKRYSDPVQLTQFVFKGLELPFLNSIRIETVITPDIDDPTKSIASSSNTASSFWINVNGQGFPFHVQATDLAGKKVNFLAELIFMNFGEAFPDSVNTTYTGSDDKRVCPVNGQKVAYASPSAGDTTLKTNSLFFAAEILNPPPPSPSTPPFVPALDRANVSVPAIEHLLGTTTPIDVQLYQPYLQHGLDSNAGVFAAVSGAPLQVVFSADKSGGFATPNLTVTALSARRGVIAGKPEDAAAGEVNPSEFFTDLNAKLFGKVPLKALIPVDGNGKASADPNAPVIKASLRPNAKNPTTEIVKVTWAPELVSYKQAGDPVEVDFNPGAALTLSTQLTRSLTGGPPQSSINGELTNFQVSLAGAIAITFNSLKFTSRNGQKLKVKADLPSDSPIQFIGPLEFVQKLADILPPGIFGGKGPSIDLKPDKIRVTYTLGLPPLSIGVFSLEHISIMTGLDLPYLDGNPALEFAFASRGSPFLLTVECVGGGGFVHIVLDADGIQMVEGALEFGAEISLDLGVASGSVRIMGGIYFQLTGTSTDLTGFVDIYGCVSVLGIISVSLDLNLSLSYKESNGKKMIQGRATLTVSIKILFFSASVSISVEKSYGREPGDPGVGDVLTASDWAAYAAAFA